MFQKNLEKSGAIVNHMSGKRGGRWYGGLWLPAAGKLDKFKEQGEDRVDEGRGENAFCCAVLVGIDIIGE